MVTFFSHLLGLVRHTSLVWIPCDLGKADFNVLLSFAHVTRANLPYFKRLYGICYLVCTKFISTTANPTFAFYRSAFTKSPVVGWTRRESAHDPSCCTSTQICMIIDGRHQTHIFDLIWQDFKHHVNHGIVSYTVIQI